MAGTLSEALNAARRQKPEPVADPPTPRTPPEATKPEQGRGGKRSDADYVRVGFLVRRDTYYNARRKSEDAGQRDFSVTVQDLIARYVNE